jgi:hypothetical protein
MNLNDSIKKEVLQLISDGKKITDHFLQYEAWYAKTKFYVKNFLPDSYKDFVILYEGNEKNKEIYDYGISRSLQVRNPIMRVREIRDVKIDRQIGILEANPNIIESKIYELEENVAISFNEAELKTAKMFLSGQEPKEIYSIRAAGASSGVVLEKHLQSILRKYSIHFVQEKDTLNILISKLNENKKISSQSTKRLSYASDIRNKCTHNKSVNPTQQDVETLISTCEWAIANIT